MKAITETLGDYILAGFSGLYVLSHEGEYLENLVRGLCVKEGYLFSRWDRGKGLTVGEDSISDSDTPLKALGNCVIKPDGNTVLFLHNFHRYLENSQVVQVLRNLLISGKSSSLTVIIISPITVLPPELERLFVVVDHPLPTQEELQDVLESIQIDGKSKAQTQGDPVSAAKGLTRLEAEDAFSLSIVQEGSVVKEEKVRKLKVQAIKKSGYLDLYEGKENFSSLGGLDALKDFCRRLLRKDSPITPRGVLLVGVPGAGKSASIKALGNETGRPVLQLDMGRMHSKYVGDSEANLRASIKLAEAMSPCILMIDEVEKGLAGVDSEGDSGVSARLFGHLLTWMSDHVSPVFLALTANNVERLPPEFSRAERIDAQFFVDLPTRKEKTLIWGMYLKEYGRKENIEGVEETIDDDGFTGAEIKSCCRLATGLDVSVKEAFEYVVPVTVSNPERIKRLREWAKGRALSATFPGVYKKEETKSVRKVKVS